MCVRVCVRACVCVCVCVCVREREREIMKEENAYYCRTGFKREHVIIENCDFSPSVQLLECNVYITHRINQYVGHAQRNY